MVYSFLVRRFARQAGAVVVAASFLPLMAAAADAPTPAVNGVVIEQAWSRPTPPGAAVGVGYMIIHNHTNAPLRLTSATTDVAAQISIHETVEDNGMMRMRPLTDGLSIAPGQSAELKPLSYHLMLEGLKQPLTVGQQIPVTLNFERIPAQHAVLDVRSLDSADEGIGEHKTMHAPAIPPAEMNHSEMDSSSKGHSAMGQSAVEH